MGTPGGDNAPLIDMTNQRAPPEIHTPTLMSPPRSKTPPTVTGKRSHSHVVGANGASRSGSEPVSAVALNKALQQMDDAGRRSMTPQGSPSRKRQRVYGGDNRFIPNRSGQDLQASYSLLDDDGSPATPSKALKKGAPSDLHFQKRDANRTYSSLLRSEMFDSRWNVVK